MQTDAMAQRKMYTVRLSDEEHEVLKAVAKHHVHTISGVIRLLAQREAERLGLEVTSTKKKARR
jgi:hypothetical protein